MSVGGGGGEGVDGDEGEERDFVWGKTLYDIYVDDTHKNSEMQL